MSFTQKILHCNNCKKEFTFTVQDQEYRCSQGYPNDPVNCPTCRRARKTNSFKETDGNGNFTSNRQMYTVTCTQCGKSTRVPFQPHPGKPIYCNECQMKTRINR